MRILTSIHIRKRYRWLNYVGLLKEIYCRISGPSTWKCRPEKSISNEEDRTKRREICWKKKGTWQTTQIVTTTRYLESRSLSDVTPLRWLVVHPTDLDLRFNYVNLFALVLCDNNRLSFFFFLLLEKQHKGRQRQSILNLMWRLRPRTRTCSRKDSFNCEWMCLVNGVQRNEALPSTILYSAGVSIFSDGFVFQVS